MRTLTSNGAVKLMVVFTDDASNEIGLALTSNQR